MELAPDEVVVTAIFERMVKRTSYRKLGAKYGVDEHTVRRWCNGETRDKCWYQARKLYKELT